ncbi:MAG: hypothetical protein KGL48_17950 [Sphingomonadales bacterium]|nr:hypothetical protein [Sphingomonadales bacterium]MDE2568622.1 hypothetical protein [Sphingomonadales bacterium]
MRLRLPAFRFNFHQPDHQNVEHGRLEMASHWLYCDRAIRRIRKGMWKATAEFDAERETSEQGCDVG